MEVFQVNSIDISIHLQGALWQGQHGLGQGLHEHLQGQFSSYVSSINHLVCLSAQSMTMAEQIELYARNNAKDYQDVF